MQEILIAIASIAFPILYDAGKKFANDLSITQKTKKRVGVSIKSMMNTLLQIINCANEIEIELRSLFTRNRDDPKYFYYLGKLGEKCEEQRKLVYKLHNDVWSSEVSEYFPKKTRDELINLLCFKFGRLGIITNFLRVVGSTNRENINISVAFQNRINELNSKELSLPWIEDKSVIKQITEEEARLYLFDNYVNPKSASEVQNRIASLKQAYSEFEQFFLDNFTIEDSIKYKIEAEKKKTK